MDTAKFLMVDPYADIAQVAPRAVNWQVKDLLNDRKDDPIDLVKLVRLICASNYRGYVPIETLPTLEEEKNKASYNAYARVPEILKRLRSALAESRANH